MTRPFALVVGGGPSGLLLALLLAKKGIPVQVIEMSTSPDEQPRATHYGPSAVHELRRAGVADEARELGFTPDSVCWRKLDGTRIAGLSNTVGIEDKDAIICLPLNRLGKILLRHLLAQPSAEVYWGHKVVDVGQDEGAAWIDVEMADGRKRMEADYVIGCDGANSIVRRSLFGEKSFPGKTWDEQIVATNTYYDFTKYGYEDANFIIHPEHWHMAARISKDGLWRVTYGEIPGLSREELLARQPAKFEAFFPSHPKPDSGEYRLANISPYRVHQRLAPKMRVGRVLLAADAAHLCNPFGGLGLTGGIVDVGGLYDCLAGIHSGLADESILDKYDEVRRQKYREIIDPMSSANIVRLFGQDPEMAGEKDEFLRMCKRTETDEKFAREMQEGVKFVMHDFTQYYKKEGEVNRNGKGKGGG